MHKKICLMLMLALTLLTINPGNSLAKDNSHAPLEWAVKNYKTPSFGLDRVYTTDYRDSIHITLDYGDTESPTYFNLYAVNPFQFFSATFDSSGQILKCTFQEGTKFTGSKNSQWQNSFLREFLSDRMNTIKLQNEKVLPLLKIAFDFLEGYQKN